VKTYDITFIYPDGKEETLSLKEQNLIEKEFIIGFSKFLNSIEEMPFKVTISI